MTSPVLDALRAFEEIDALMLGSRHPRSGDVMAQVRHGVRALAQLINEKAPLERGCDQERTNV